MAVLKSTRLRLKTSGSVDAVREYLRTTREYYAQEGLSGDGKTILPDAEWLDSPATDRLGLNDPGRDPDEDFAKLLAGYHPRTGTPLVQNAGEAGRCMGLDLTFSPRKEYTLALIAATPEQREQMTQAFHLARDKALALISSGLNTRAGKGGKRHVAIDGLVIRAVDHIDSRTGDPQWHCHAVVANVALDTDGEWRSVDFRDLMRTTGSLQEAAQEVFARELAEGFQRLGFGIERTRILDEDERDTGRVANKIAGIEQATCEAFSSRRAEIKEAIKAAAEQGETLTGGEAAMKTRQSKHLSASEVIVAARTRLEELAALTPGHFVRADDLLGRESTELEKLKNASQWFDELHAMDSHWNRSGLIAKLARELPLGGGIDIPAEADRLLAEWEAKAELEAISLMQAVKQRAEKAAALQRTLSRLQGQTKQDLQRVRRQRQVALGLDTTTPFEDIDWTTSTFPDRDKRTRVEPEAMRNPATAGRNPAPEPRRRAGMFPTQPRLPTAPEPPKPPGMEIGF